MHVKKITRRNEVMTLLRHKYLFDAFFGHFGRVFGPIASKFGTKIGIMQAHRSMRKKSSRRKDVVTLLGNSVTFGTISPP